MQYNVTTKQGNNYIVSDESAWLWIEIERELGYTVSQAADNQAALANLETLIFSVTDLLANNISFLGGWSQPTVQQIGNADMLISQLNIEMVTTN